MIFLFSTKSQALALICRIRIRSSKLILTRFAPSHFLCITGTPWSCSRIKYLADQSPVQSLLGGPFVPTTGLTCLVPTHTSFAVSDQVAAVALDLNHPPNQSHQISIVGNPAIMASHEYVIVPAHTPKPLPSHLRSELTSALLSNSAIPVIQSTLHEASQEVYWERSIQERAKQIIVQEHATGWQEVVDMLVKESCEPPHNSPHHRPQVSGRLRRLRQDQSSFTGPANSPTEAINVTFPEQARKAGKKAIREALDPLIEVESTGASR